MIVQQIKDRLPNFPDDVIDIWLRPYAEDLDYGWPPPTDPTTEQFRRWWYVLLKKGLGTYWAKTAWQHGTRQLALEELEPSSQYAASAVYESNVLGHENSFSQIKQSKNRFKRIIQAIDGSGIIPRPVIMLEKLDGLHTIDGHHRMAALLHRRACWHDSEKRQALMLNGAIQPETTQPLWICHPPPGSLQTRLS